MHQIMQFLSATYLTVPTLDLNTGESTSMGTGTMISTLLAMDFCLNWVLAFTTNSILDCVQFSTTASTQMRGLTCVSTLYVMSSNSPSGGMNVIRRSVSNLFSLTHWWNLRSSRSISLLLVCFPVISKSVLSFSPSFSSGIPLREDLILTEPMISDRTTFPLFETRMLSFSITSRKTSFFWCLMPSVLQETTLLAEVGTTSLFTVS
mmetsp:Transcript_16551/g.28145  ORF Transcript_16551/g.28145 Transcript_16551/m.28145 type:complete len:206 (+) Transcript_16551:273-890(+)